MPKCANPPELEDHVLLLYLDGDAGPEVSGHLSICPHCRGRLNQARSFQNRLRRDLHRVDCPPASRLGEYQLGLLGKSDKKQIASHVASCPHCRQELKQLVNFFDATAVPERNQPDIHQRVKILIAGRMGGGRNAGSLTSAPVGLRGERDRPLVFETGPFQVTLLRDERSDRTDSVKILGLILGGEIENWKAHLWQSTRQIGTRDVDEVGNFQFAGIRPGRYNLILEGDGVEVHIQEFEI
jgi:hypothetical protein